MPVYEYYCSICNGRFSHLARGFDDTPPPCPGCGSHEAEKLISQINVGRSESQRRADIDARAREVNQEDPQEMARFLQDEAGSLAEDMAPVEREAFREILARRTEGAGDEDLEDVVDAIPFRRQSFAHPHAHGHEHDHTCGEHCEHDHGHPKKPQSGSSREPRDLGWA